MPPTYLLVVGVIEDKQRIDQALTALRKKKRHAEVAYVEDSSAVRDAITGELAFNGLTEQEEQIQLYTYYVAGVIADCDAWENPAGVIAALQGSSQYSRIAGHRIMVDQRGRARKR